ncbi:MAG: hypothetical protein ACRDS0_32075 [Pseudonocardiaceae bacterium]
MTLVSSGVTDRLVDEPDEGLPDGRSWWIPRWVHRRREADELGRWVSEVTWLWSSAMDGAHLADHTLSGAKLPVMVAPEVQSVDPGPPVTLLVRMLPGQTIADFQDKAHRIAAGMGVPAAQIMPFDDDLINVVLLDHDQPSEETPDPV